MKEPASNLDSLIDKTISHLKHKRYVYRPRKELKKKIGSRWVTQRDAEGNIMFTDDFHPPTPNKRILLSLAFNMAFKNYRNIRSPFTGVKKIKEIGQVSEMLIRFFSNKYYKDINDIQQSDLINSSEDLEYQAVDRFRNLEYTLYGTVERLRNYYSHYIHEPGVLSFQSLLLDEAKTLNQDEHDIANNWFQKRFDDVHGHLTASLEDRKKKLEEEKTALKGLDEIQQEKAIKAFETKRKQINRSLSFFKRMVFIGSDNLVTIEGQLFIACMFLFKRQAKIILDKWQQLKNVEGYENTKHTFFTYYCLKESYSIINYDDDLLKFRNIVSKLSALPYSNNPQLRFVYDLVKEFNKETKEKLDQFPKLSELKQKIKALENKIDHGNFRPNENKHKVQRKIDRLNRSKKEHETLNKKIIPYRKRNIYTETLLQYVVDNKLLPNKYDEEGQLKFPILKIAIAKTMTDRAGYIAHFDELVNGESFTQLKERIKSEKDPDKRTLLNEHLKELKRNFIFKTPEELLKRQKPRYVKDENCKKDKAYLKEPEGYHFFINKKNVLIQYETKEGVLSNITLSPDLLMKWVVIHLEKNENIWSSILKRYIEQHNQKFKKNTIKEVFLAFKKDPFYKNINIKKYLPSSIRQTSEETKQFYEENYLLKKTYTHIENRITVLENFKDENNQKEYPWKYASKRKIDTIIHYLHFRLMFDVYINNINASVDEVTYIRHKMFNMNTYNIVRHYFRFFGRFQRNTLAGLEKAEREYVTVTVAERLKESYSHLFKYIQDELEQCFSLEEMFNAVIEKQIHLLKEITKLETFEKYALEKWTKLFKINKVSEEENIHEILKTHYVRSFAIPPSLISIEANFPDQWRDFKVRKEQELTERKQNPLLELKSGSFKFKYSEFAFLRDYFIRKDNPKTNIDFILSVILNNEKQKPSVYKHLLSIKTEELVLWNIAKSYWTKATGNPYDLDAIEGDVESAVFQEYCSFSKVYQKDLTYDLSIDDAFWNASRKKIFSEIYDGLPEGNKGVKILIKVPAKKYDNKLLSAESQLIQEFCLWYLYDNKTRQVNFPDRYEYKNDTNIYVYNLNKYEDLIKVVHKHLEQSIRDIFQLLRAEKRIIEGKKEDYINLLKEKYKDKTPIEDFYLTLSTNTGEFSKEDRLYKDFIEAIPDAFSEEDKTIYKDHLVFFRNFALHYQLQNPKVKKVVLGILKRINSKVHPEEYFIYP